MNNTKILFIKGVFWNTVQTVVSRSFGVAVKLILAKLLFPEQFGLIGMATVVIGFVTVLCNLGISSALVQIKDEKLTSDHYNTAFWTGTCWAVIMYLLISFPGGYLAADFYGEPILKQLIPVLAISLLVNALVVVQRVRLTRALNFKRIAIIENISAIAAGILSIGLAYYGMGVWSLAFNSIVAICISVPLYFRAAIWRPALSWSRDAFNDIFGFGVYTTFTEVVNYFISSSDYLILGKILGAGPLGIYSIAYLLTDTIRGQLMAMTNTVIYPIYGKHQSDPLSLKRYYLKIIEYNSIVVYPVMLFLILFGEEFLLFVVGERWISAAAPMRILSLAMMVHMMVNSNTVLIRGLGRPGLELTLQLVKSLFFIPAVFLGVYWYGVLGCAWAILINKVFAVILAQFTFNYLIDIRISTYDFLYALRVPFLATLASGVASFGLGRAAQTHFILAGTVLFVVYAAVVLVMMKNELLGHLGDIRADLGKKANPVE